MISINATLVVQLINFLVLIWILNRLLFRPIFRIMQDRQDTVDQARARFRNLKDEVESKSQKIEAELRKARAKASEDGQQIKSEASAQAKELIEASQAKAQEHVASVEAEVQRQAADVRTSLDQYRDAIVEMVTMKVMGRKVT
jgi:F-type H+-transporting ATPase subunit b